MERHSLLTWIVGAVILLFVAILSKLLSKKIRIPYSIWLVFAGIIFEYLFAKCTDLHGMPLSTSHDIIMYILLPVLIFEAALSINTRLLINNLKPILILAIPGLIISTFFVGFFMNFLSPLDLGVAMLFGALISATDPVAVISIFKALGAPKRLTVLVDGESLFNDATAIVMYQAVLSLVISGTALSWLTLGKKAVGFLVVFFGGFLVGAIVSFVIVHIFKYMEEDPVLTTALSVFIAYFSFIVSDHFLNLSGVMAALGAGIVASYYGKHLLRHKTKLALAEFWEFASFVANSYVFLIVGIFGKQLIETVEDHFQLLGMIALAIIAIIIGRFIIIYGLLPLTCRNEKDKVSRPYKHILFWGGLRGAVALALAMSLPKTIENRLEIIGITIGVVLFTLFVQGTTTRGIMNHLKINEPHKAKKDPQVQPEK
ncbi:MAG: sodium:proton antiporter [Candidatus Eremiobacteraeota bacterium]|nr:sodium:proton antiporter [Candidatus Eremiobacteraeota bacterium]